MNDAELRDLLEGQIPRIAGALMEIAAPTIRIYLDPADDGAIPVGASKMGGGADLPPGVEWPSWHEPMAFIAQLNLAEVAPYDREGALPDHGLLSFFYETDGEPLYAERWGLPEETPYDEAYYHKPVHLSWRVLYHEGDPATFIRHQIPPEVNEMARYSPCAARFAGELTLPDVDGPQMAPLELTRDERTTLIDLDAEINHGSWEEGGHHLLGYHYIYSTTLADIDREAQGIPFDAERERDRRDKLRREEEASRRWRLLLQVSSSDDTQMDWAGGGVLYYFVEREALRDRGFPRVWVDLGFL